MINMPRILHEDESILVIDKPEGLMAHGDGRSKESTLADWLLQNYPALASVGEPLMLPSGEVVQKPGLVHRLDRDTSGVMVIAKTPEAHARLKEQFMAHTVQKTYRVFVHGRIREERGSIDRPIGKSRTDFRQWSASGNPRGRMRPARTDFRLILASGTASYLEAFPRTGRTHQIRVHFKAIHHPVLCDALYGGNKGCALGFTRLALHANELHFVHPGTGEAVSFEAPLPKEFLHAEEALRAHVVESRGGAQI